MSQLTLFGKRVILVDAVPKGWRFSNGAILLTPAELAQVEYELVLPCRANNPESFLAALVAERQVEKVKRGEAA